MLQQATVWRNNPQYDNDIAIGSEATVLRRDCCLGSSSGGSSLLNVRPIAELTKSRLYSVRSPSSVWVQYSVQGTCSLWRRVQAKPSQARFLLASTQPSHAIPQHFISPRCYHQLSLLLPSHQHFPLELTQIQIYIGIIYLAADILPLPLIRRHLGRLIQDSHRGRGSGNIGSPA